MERGIFAREDTRHVKGPSARTRMWSRHMDAWLHIITAKYTSSKWSNNVYITTHVIHALLLHHLFFSFLDKRNGKKQL